MKQLLLFVLVLLLAFTGVGKAQNPNPTATLSGPSLFCGSGTFTLTSDTAGFVFYYVSVENISVDPNDLTITPLGLNEISFTFSGLNDGDYSGIVVIQLFSPDIPDNVFQSEIPFEFTVASNTPLTINTLGAFCLPDSSVLNASCTKVCNRTLATYEVNGISSSDELIWNISGAESYVINGNQATVQWGESGQGDIDVSTVEDTANPVAPLRVYAGNNGALSDNFFVNIITGQAPMVISIYDLNGVLESQTTTAPLGLYSYNLEPGIHQLVVVDALGQSYIAAISDVFNWGASMSLLGSGFDCNNPSQTTLFASVFSAPDLSLPAPQQPTYTYLWSNGSLENPIQPTSPGIYFVTITQNSFVGGTAITQSQVFYYGILCPEEQCTANGQLCVQVLDEVTASLSSTPQANVSGIVELCAGQTLYLNNSSLGAADYLWDFGDGNLSSAFAPAHTYNNAGTFVLRMVARNACYCTDTTVLTVVVLATPKPDIDCVGTLCMGETATYTTASFCNGYLWTVSDQGSIVSGGGTSDNFVEITWNSGPEGTVSLQMLGCPGIACTAPNVLNVPILSGTATITGPAVVCPGSTESYALPNYQGTLFNWIVSAGGEIISGLGTHQITVQWSDVNSGPQLVEVTYDNCYLDCGGQAALAVAMQGKFFVLGPITACANSATSHISKNTNGDLMLCNWTSYNADGVVVWSSVAPTSNVNVPWGLSDGKFTLVATPAVAADYCIESFKVFIDISALPPAPANIVGATEISAGQAYTYTAFPTGQYGIAWTIQNGTIEQVTSNPANVLWNNNGPFGLSVVFTGLDASGCVSAATQIDIDTLSALLPITGEISTCINQIQAYSTPFITDAAFVWNILPSDAGTIVAGQGSANIEVQWHIVGAALLQIGLCNNTGAVTVNVNGAPQPFIPESNVCPTTNVLVAGGSYASFAWLDETGVLVATTPSASLAAGYYELEVTDINGCVGDTTFRIKSWPAPQSTISTPDFTDFFCPGNLVNLYASTTESGYAFLWQRNGITLAGTNDNIAATQAGTYQAIATNAFGCLGPSNLITITDCAAAGGTCVNGVCSVSSSGQGGSCGPNGSIDFNIAATNNCNIHDYINTSVNAVAGSFLWSGFESSATTANHSITVATPGYGVVYLVGLVPSLADPNTNCAIIVAKQDVFEAVANFSSDIVCAGLATNFSDLSEFMPQFSIAGWSWNFGDPTSGANNTGVGQNPTHIYSLAGQYTATLTITLSSGCQSVATQLVEVAGTPAGNIQLPTATCENTPLLFTGSFTNVTSYFWDFGDAAQGTTNTANIDSAYHVFANSDTYTVSLTVRNIYGCQETYFENIVITPNTLTGNIGAVPPSPLCAGLASVLTAPAGGNVFLWSDGATTNSITSSISGIYGVIISNAAGCSYAPPAYNLDVLAPPFTVIQGVQYNEYNQPIGYIDNSIAACEGQDIYLQASNQTPNTSIVWSTGSSLGSISFTDDKGNLLSVGTYTFDVTITDLSSGCSYEADPFIVVINPVPDVAISALPAGFLCENSTATLNVSAADATNTYFWNTGQTGNSIVTAQAGYYFCQAVSANGCSSKSNVIEILASPNTAVVPTGCLVRCQPDTMCLPFLPNISSYQWLLDGLPIAAPNGNNPNAIFTEEGNYSLEIVDDFGCQNTSPSLTLDLFLGYGDIEGIVYADVNLNGIIDAGDTLMSNISILLNDNESSSTNAEGEFLFSNVAAIAYTMTLDTASFPNGFSAVWSTVIANLVGCNDTTAVAWLLQPSCETSTTNLEIEICSESIYLYQSDTLTAGENETFVFVAQNGCDSLVNIAITALPHALLDLQESSCPDIPFNYLGTPVMPGTPTLFTSINALGCLDSTTLLVSEWPTYDTSFSVPVCFNELLLYEGVALEDGATETFTFTSINGCDSLVTVTAFAAAAFAVVAEVQSSCYDAATGAIDLQTTGTSAPYTYTLNNGLAQTSPTFSMLGEGIYSLVTTDINQCTTATSIVVPAIASYAVEGLSALIGCQQTIELQPELSGFYNSILWFNGNNAPTFNANQPGNYGFTVFGSCDTTEHIFSLLEADGTTEAAYLPNIFTPNNDNINDCFKPYFEPGITVISLEFMVFDRWGNEIYNTTDLNACWDGTYRNTLLSPQVLGWHLKGLALDCFGRPLKILEKGDVLLTN